MKTTRERPWLCFSCGYEMDAASSVVGDAVPADGDVAACLNCGALAVRAAGRWRPMTEADRAALDDAQKRLLTRMEIARLLSCFPDLRRDPGGRQ